MHSQPSNCNFIGQVYRSIPNKENKEKKPSKTSKEKGNQNILPLQMHCMEIPQAL